jgi:hypothetical protein
MTAVEEIKTAIAKDHEAHVRSYRHAVATLAKGEELSTKVQAALIATMEHLSIDTTTLDQDVATMQTLDRLTKESVGADERAKAATEEGKAARDKARELRAEVVKLEGIAVNTIARIQTINAPVHEISRIKKTHPRLFGVFTKPSPAQPTQSATNLPQMMTTDYLDR